MRIKVKSIEYYGYNLTIYDNSSDYPLNGPWYLVAIENSLEGGLEKMNFIKTVPFK